MTEKKPLIYFSLVEWDFLWSRPQQIISRLAENRKVLYVEVHGVRNLAKSFQFPRDLFRILRKIYIWIRSLITGARRVEGQLWVINPIIIPTISLQALSAVNNWLLFITIRYWMRKLSLLNPVLLFTIPRPELLALIGRLNESQVCYDCMDDYSDFPASHESLNEWETQLLSKADLVTVSSKPLQEKKAKHHSRVILIPNGVEFDHFHRAWSSHLAEPSELRSISHPRIIYIGVINEWFDTDIFRHCVDEHPHWNFLLIGIDVIGLARKENKSNVFFFGRKPYQELPDYLAHSDVCIIPFKITPLTIATNPIKMYEYLAAGKPVVSTPLPEVVQYSDIISIGSTAVEFEARIEAALPAASQSEIDHRLNFARQHSWDARSRDMENALEGDVRDVSVES
ncbi:glycosyltransferase [candidate division CSSED10-310 bacterium]|uniref:Glycosyltransferase n=1 Tax=candidate division CSSED10-310 bacterium TaxID=2855610 RepID=A0ABV6YXK3_UNCC1